MICTFIEHWVHYIKHMITLEAHCILQVVVSPHLLLKNQWRVLEAV